ncbi:hypothetical protein [Ochrobactrum sp. Marseille-Q0166]|uniref:hypothetical protein n=1 Tax=Ochrobactrum sp. Marseille-Q0166 TaxID=2761105 RepID=UPI0016563FA3|nr:hypothetical protein [Ochrobactrum sp. Marseille-Q0166]MBC8718805.1 hypothetical protein [Ochrobactrum sp. Marseille-Q0166]
MVKDGHLAAHNAHQFLDRSILVMLIKSGVLSKDVAVSFLRDQVKQLYDSGQTEEAKLIHNFVDVLEASLTEIESGVKH